MYYHLLIEMYAKGLSEKELADKLHINETLLKQKIEGKILFTQKEKEKIIDIFSNSHPTYLFNE